MNELEGLLTSLRAFPPLGSGRAAPSLTREIEFRDVTYQYEEALLGASGAGKSTLLMLLCRLVDPTRGEILVDGVPLREIEPLSWHRRIGIAGQDIDLIDGSIADNIGYGMEAAALHQVEEAARLAHAHEFISTFPQGYSTRVGARGLSLSGGQRQRIGIARALLRKPEILILDEATNALDAKAGSAIDEVIASLSGAVTVIVVSHNTQALHHCERAILLDRGRVQAHGSMQDLALRSAKAQGD